MAQRDAFTTGFQHMTPPPSAQRRPICRPWPMAAYNAASMAAETLQKRRLLAAPFASGSSNRAGTACHASFAAFGLAEETWSSWPGPCSNNGLCAYPRPVA